MSHRAHLFTLRIAHACREVLTEGYDRKKLTKDVFAGITVGIIAIPLAMALAIASGVAPQYGLYTAIIGGFIVALLGGSRYSITGPTAAFVVILYPITQQYGLAGLLLASMLAGVILIIMAYARLGRFIEYIPEAVTLGFTGGIAIVLATLQITDLLGLSGLTLPAHYIEKLLVIVQAMPDYDTASLGIGLLTLALMLIWPRLGTPLPAHLPAVIVASLAAWWLTSLGYEIDTIGSRFSYLLADGTQAMGIPSDLPHFDWPWQRPGANGEPFVLSWGLLVALLPSAFAIAILGAIESLLCAVVLDGMSGKRHSANSELLGQGIGNILLPFFGGITATAAIARSTANFKVGAQSPVAAMIHALTVLLALLLLAKILAYLPMPAMAALLLVVAWNMSEAPKAWHLVKTAPPRDVAVFVVCISLTVLFDMVIAITTGMLLASVLFMHELASMTKVSDITNKQVPGRKDLPAQWRVYSVHGPLFFAAADRVFGELSLKLRDYDGLVISMEHVSLLDAGGIAALNKLMNLCERSNKTVYCTDWQFQPLRTLARSGLQPIPGKVMFFHNLAAACDPKLPTNILVRAYWPVCQPARRPHRDTQ